MAKDQRMKNRLRKASKAHQKYKLRDGTIVPGVTTITGQMAKPALMTWSNRLGLDGIEYKTFLDNTAQAGTCGHLLVTERLKGNVKPDLSEFTAIQIEAGRLSEAHFWEWWHEVDAKPLYVEQSYVSEVWRFGGQCDLIAEIDGRVEIVDLKTGSGIYPEMYTQVAGYAILAEENGISIDRARILNIPREEANPFLEAVVPMLEVEKELFLKLLEVYQLRKGLGK
ncbi:MAG: PD-(D/E)XK nuclease family protein [Chloroflexi bacterium]|nr:PD-(D/E)XK nuclease family protein [Chloroflexota bacterium]